MQQTLLQDVRLRQPNNEADPAPHGRLVCLEQYKQGRMHSKRKVYGWRCRSWSAQLYGGR